MQRRLDHHDVGPFLEIELDLAQRFLDVGGIHLVRPAIAERGCRIGGVAERTVERRAVLRGVGHDRDLAEAGVIEHVADAADAAVHHVGRRDDVGAGGGVRERGARQLLDRRVVDDLLAVEDAAVAVRGVLAQADVGDDDAGPARRVLSARTAVWTGPSGSAAPLPAASFVSGRPNSSTPGTPSAFAAAASFTISSTDSWKTPGIDADFAPLAFAGARRTADR